MASTYVNNLRLNELATGDGSGTWGTTTNTNLELIGQALGWGTRAIANASTDNITIADGASDADRNMALKLTGGGQACTVTILPNTSSKVWVMENATAATLTFTAGSGANVAILAGETKMIATDGGGSGGVVYDVLTDLNLAGTTKTAALTVAGLTSIDTNKKIQFRDAAIHISSSADGQLDLVADTEIQIAATTVDINGAVLLSADLSVGDDLTVAGGVIDFKSNSGSPASLRMYCETSNAHFQTLQPQPHSASAANTLRLPNSGDSGTQDLVAVNITQTLTNKTLTAPTITGTAVMATLDISGDVDVDGTTNLDVVDIDGAVNIATTALVTGILTTTAATVHNGGITMPDNAKALFGTGDDLQIYHDGSNSWIKGNNAGNNTVVVAPGGTGSVLITNSSGDNIITQQGDVAMLHHNGSTKLATKASGVTVTGEVAATSLDISGDVDVDGTLEADAITLAGTALASIFSPIAGGGSIVTTGALNSGTITSGFGTINNGSSTITTSGAVSTGTIAAGGKITADAGIDIDNFNIDGTTIALSSGSMTLDVAAQIILDAADDGNIQLRDAGTQYGAFYSINSGDWYFKSSVSDKDIIFQGVDGGSQITALTLDMSAAGAATFNNDVTAFSDERLKSNITTIPDALSKVTEMRGVHYVRDATGKDSTGVIAQELQKIAPELVLTAEDEMGTLSVNYGNITGYLIEAVKELSARVKELEGK